MKIKRALSIIVFAVLLVASAATSFYWYKKYQTVLHLPESGSKDEAAILIKKISSFMELPQETPSVVTITDRDKLQNQEFFQKAQNGDKILIFQNTRRIILYRPDTGRVIDVAPLVFNDITPSPQPPINIPLPEPTATP